MSDEDSRNGRGVVVAPSTVPTMVPLGPSSSLDLSWLPEAERKALLTEYTRGILDISRKAQELHVDVGVLKNTLGTLSATTKDVAESGNSVTVTHSVDTNIGRTEIIMGNTENAKTGKLTRSQTGQQDLTRYYVIAGLVALIIIVALLTHK